MKKTLTLALGILVAFMVAVFPHVEQGDLVVQSMGVGRITSIFSLIDAAMFAATGL